MFSSLRNVPRESRVLVVVSLTVLLQVLVLSGFGLAALSGQEAEEEKSTREICAHVLDRYLVGEVNRRVEAEEKQAVETLAPLTVEVPGSDPVLGRVLREVAAAGTIYPRLFLVTPDGAWQNEAQELLWPVASTAPAPTGSDDVGVLEEVEERARGEGDLLPAIELLREKLAGMDAATEAEGFLLLARLLRRAGRGAEAAEAYDRIVRDYPVSRDAVGLLLGPAAARWRALERLELLRSGDCGPEVFVTDVLDLRRILLQNRFQMREDRAEWELSQLRRIAEDGAAALPVVERVRLADGLAEFAELQKTVLVFRAVFTDEIRRVLTGHADGGRIYKASLDGPREAFLIPVADRTGNRTAVVVLEMDLNHIRGGLLPAVIADLPLPPGVAASILDTKGEVVVGTVGLRGLELAKETLGDALPFYQPVLFLKDPDLLSRQTESTRRLHQWIMAASIAGILAAGWFVGRTVAGELKVAKLKSDFLSNVTHELKTPLTSIRMFVEMLCEGRVKDEEERREYLGIISREADRLTGLIQRVLDLARFEGKKSGGLQPEPTDIGRLVRDTADLFRLRMGDSEATLRVELQDQLGTGMLDQGAIQEVLLNLLGNAVKYGGREIVLSVSAKGGVATIEVADDGIGISEEDLKHIFEKFYRADESLARQVEGSGLGLALVRQIVRAHRGRIRVKSEKGQGSRFTVSLPLKELRG